MRHRQLFAALAAIPVLFLLDATALAQQTDYRPEMAARIETIPIPTLTLTDEQFLRGDSYGRPTIIAGELRIAQGTGRLPAVVFIPGSAGHAPNSDVWSDVLLAQGISIFAIDPLAGRGIVSAGVDRSLLGQLTSIVDLYAALAVLADHPRVDPERIAVMGLSRGGVAALYSSLTRFQEMWNRSGIEPAAHVALYPSCFTSYVGDTDVTSRPIRLFHGTADVLVPIQPCRDYVDRLAAAGVDVALTEMPGAFHGYDSPNFPQDPPLAVAQVQFVHCLVREEPVGTLVNTETQQPFTLADPCVGRGTQLAYSPAATRATEAAVVELLRAVFGLAE